MGERNADYGHIINEMIDWYLAMEGIGPPSSNDLELEGIERYAYNALMTLRSINNKEV